MSYVEHLRFLACVHKTDNTHRTYYDHHTEHSLRDGALGQTELRLYGVLRSSQHATSHGRSLPSTLLFDGYPYDVVLTLPGIDEAQLLHDGPVGVPYLVALVPIERKEAHEFFVRPAFDQHLGTPFFARYRAYRVPHRQRVQRHKLCDLFDRTTAQLFPDRGEDASVVSHAVLDLPTMLLQVSDHGEDPCGRVALGLGADLFWREQRNNGASVASDTRALLPLQCTPEHDASRTSLAHMSMPLFTEVRGTGVLRSSLPAS